MIRASFLSAALTAVLAVSSDAGAQRSDRIIDLHVNVEAESRSFTGSVLEGGRFRITYHDIGTFELLPLVVDQEQGIFRVTVFRGPEGASGSQLREVETVTARRGVPVALRSMPSTGLVIDGIRTAAERSVIPAFASLGALPSAARWECCHTCGNVTACGCRVVSECGGCCVGACCPRMEDPTSTDRFFPAPRGFTSANNDCGQPIRNEERLFTARTSVAASR
jgi:hypothetical protein